MRNNRFLCKLGTCSSIAKYKKLKCLKIDFVLMDQNTEKSVSEFLESCGYGYSGKIYKNCNNCIAVLSNNCGLKILELDDIIVQMPDNGIYVYSLEEFANQFKFIETKNKKGSK